MQRRPGPAPAPSRIRPGARSRWDRSAIRSTGAAIVVSPLLPHAERQPKKGSSVVVQGVWLTKTDARPMARPALGQARVEAIQRIARRLSARRSPRRGAHADTPIVVAGLSEPASSATCSIAYPTEIARRPPPTTSRRVRSLAPSASAAPRRAPGTASHDQSQADPQVDMAEDRVHDRARHDQRDDHEERRPEGPLQRHPEPSGQQRDHHQPAADTQEPGHEAGDCPDPGEDRGRRLAGLAATVPARVPDDGDGLPPQQQRRRRGAAAPCRRTP